MLAEKEKHGRQKFGTVDGTCPSVWVGDVFAMTRADGFELNKFFKVCVLDKWFERDFFSPSSKISNDVIVLRKNLIQRLH